MVSPDTWALRNDDSTRSFQDRPPGASAPAPSSTRPRRCGSASKSLPNAGINRRLARSPLAPSTTNMEIVASANGAPDPVTSGPDVVEETLIAASADRLQCVPDTLLPALPSPCRTHPQVKTTDQPRAKDPVCLL